MQNQTAAAAERKAPGAFRRGRVCRVGDLNLAVTAVGKTLVHSKRYKTQPRGVQITLNSKPDPQKSLVSNRAVLIAE